MILLGVSGGVAAYKSCELVRLLVRAGHDVQVMLTPAAERFVGETTFAALSRRPVLTERSAEVFPHLEASAAAALCCIAPASANTIAVLAHGEAPTVLAQSALAFTGPLLVAPAMNPRMWSAAATVSNVQTLRDRGVELIGPERGEMAEGEHGLGRMTEPEEIAERIERRLDAARRLAGRRVLVTAGGTREPLDAVRFLGNRSSGRMGVAVADEAARRGAQVTLILAAGGATPSAPMRTLRAESAEQLHRATLEEAATADVVVMAAAVADYRPAESETRKRPKDGNPWTVTLEPTTDVLRELGAGRTNGTILVGFAADVGERGLERARAKLADKQVDLIVFNDVSRADIGFDAADNEVVLVSADGEKRLEKSSKERIAAAILDAVAERLGA
jgi:phosphopantothenoylcysteine decarboxylase / phosphopantothenate---cysteine ligase